MKNLYVDVKYAILVVTTCCILHKICCMSHDIGVVEMQDLQPILNENRGIPTRIHLNGHYLKRDKE